MSAIKTTTGVLAAGAFITYPFRGSFIYLREADGELVVSASLVELGQRTGQTTKVKMSGSDKIRPTKEYDQVTLTNDTAASITYELVTGDGDYDRPIPDTINVSVSVPASDTINGTADVTISGTTNATADQILAANASRIRAIITANAANDQTIRISGSDVDSNIGIPLAAGESVAIDSTGAIWGCEEVAGTNTVAIVEYE